MPNWPAWSQHFLDGVDALPAGAFLGVPVLDGAGEDADGLAAEPAGVLDPAFDVVDLFLEASRVVDAEVVADRGAADVEAEPRAAALEPGEVAGVGCRGK